MTNNIAVTVGTGVTKTIGTDQISSIDYQIAKIGWGDAGAINQASAANPLPTVQTGALPAGSNIIGKVSIDQTTPGTTNLVSLAAGSNSVGTVVQANTTSNIGAALQTDVIMNNLTALTPKFATIAASSSGNNTIVGAVSSKKIRVLQYVLVSNGTVNAKWQSGASGTDLTGLSYLVANTGVSAPFSPVGLFETAAGTLLNLNLSGSIAVGGHIVYVEV